MFVLAPFITPFLALAAVAYAALAVYMVRSGPQYANSLVGYFLFVIGGMLAGSAFSFNATDVNMYGFGRVLSFLSAGFMPIVFYAIYREYTVGPPSFLLIAMLSVVPLVTGVLAMTDSLHHLVWLAEETGGQLTTSQLTDHYWYNRIYAPFIYGLLGYSAVALISCLPGIAPAHRKVITLWLVCALLPVGVSVANNFFGFGPPNFPATSLVLALELPIFAYASLALRVHEFSPLAYQTLFDHVRDPIFVVDSEQRIICANKAAQVLLEGKEEDLIGCKLWEEFPAARAILQQARELDLTQTLRMDTKNIYEVSVGPLAGPKGQDVGMVVVCRDVTERRKALGQLADSEHLIRTLIETSSNGFLRFARDNSDPDHKFRCVFANRSAETFAGEVQGTLVGMPLEELGHLNPERLLSHFGADKNASTQMSYEVEGVTDLDESGLDGSGLGHKWLRIIGEPVGADFSVTLIDITQRKRNEDKMLADALRDPLTGILNRRGFEQEGAAAIRGSKVGAVLYLDLNQFKTINDRFGHQAGDALLKAFGHRLEFCLRPEDVIGRLGGDEFSIVLPDVGLDDVRHITERLVQTASEAYIIQGQEIKCTASVGIALMPKHGEELWHLVSVADQAMYYAKRIPDEEAANDRAAYIDAATAS